MLDQLLRPLALLVTVCLFSSTTTVYAEGTWVLWEHAYEVWIDNSKENHQRHVFWKKVTATTTKADCDSRTLDEAQAEYSIQTGRGVGATLEGSKVGFGQKNTRYRHGYRSFECWPSNVDPRGPKGE